jgi:hypothetical protein
MAVYTRFASTAPGSRLGAAQAEKDAAEEERGAAGSPGHEIPRLRKYIYRIKTHVYLF